jgi:hypothetical protein
MPFHIQALFAEDQPEAIFLIVSGAIDFFNQVVSQRAEINLLKHTSTPHSFRAISAIVS